MSWLNVSWPVVVPLGEANIWWSSGMNAFLHADGKVGRGSKRPPTDAERAEILAGIVRLRELCHRTLAELDAAEVVVAKPGLAAGGPLAASPIPTRGRLADLRVSASPNVRRGDHAFFCSACGTGFVAVGYWGREGAGGDVSCDHCHAVWGTEYHLDPSGNATAWLCRLKRLPESVAPRA